ncbi:MAG: hypothetical protein LQ340_002634 [Diploschistes diacapsis]|nr:MAG: hypothetical protein LQ340_002634 [Diploschistes diacapsis]
MERVTAAITFILPDLLVWVTLHHIKEFSTTLASVLTSSSWENVTGSTEGTTIFCTNAEQADSSRARRPSRQASTSINFSSPPSPSHAGELGSEHGSDANHEEVGGNREGLPLRQARPKPSVTNRERPSPRKLRQRLASLFRSLRRPGSLKSLIRPQQTTSVSSAGEGTAIRDIGRFPDVPPQESSKSAQGSRLEDAPVPRQVLNRSSASASIFSKRQRVTAFRREKTLRRDAQRRRRCHCLPGCFCVRQQSAQALHTSPRESNQAQPPLERRSDPSSVASPDSPPETPCAVIERIRNATAFLGAHLLDATYRASIDRESPIQLEYLPPLPSRQPSTSTATTGRISQATTAIENGNSSHFREGDRPLFRRRSNRSTALLPDVSLRFNEQQHPEVMQVIRRIEEVGLAPATRRGTDNTDYFSTFSATWPLRQRTMHSSSSESAGAGAGAAAASMRLSTASLARLATALADGSGNRNGVLGQLEGDRPTRLNAHARDERVSEMALRPALRPTSLHVDAGEDEVPEVPYQPGRHHW